VPEIGEDGLTTHIITTRLIAMVLPRPGRMPDAAAPFRVA